MRSAQFDAAGSSLVCRCGAGTGAARELRHAGAGAGSGRRDGIFIHHLVIRMDGALAVVVWRRRGGGGAPGSARTRGRRGGKDRPTPWRRKSPDIMLSAARATVYA